MTMDLASITVFAWVLTLGSAFTAALVVAALDRVLP